MCTKRAIRGSGRTVALKFLPHRQASNPAARARLLAEARSASSLDHPNIGVVHDSADLGNGQRFIAMAWYDGKTLKHKHRNGPLPVAQSVEIAKQIADALTAAHRAGIIHRDVKPANVVLIPTGTAKLLDFGIAKLISDNEDDIDSAAGTVAYMSPEQTRKRNVDARTDTWSLGVLLYEILAGQRPFSGDTDEQNFAAIRDQEPAPLASIRPDIPDALLRIVERRARKDPDNRFQTAESFAVH